MADAVSKHHERPDGRGYPRGLSGDQIPLDARIVGICDAFDAMTSHRPYRAGMTEERALAILQEEAGHQFDAGLVAAFVSLGKSGQLSSVVGHSDNGIPLASCPKCGPTLVIRREQKAGEKIYCRNCSGEFELTVVADRQLQTEPTGNVGSVKDLEPEADTALIARTVQSIAEALPLSDLIK